MNFVFYNKNFYLCKKQKKNLYQVYDVHLYYFFFFYRF